MSDRSIWWVSFASDEGPLGVVVTIDEEDGNVVALARRLWRQGVNPGGEMLALLAPREQYRDVDSWALEPGNQDRLIPLEELAKFDVPRTTDEELESHGVDPGEWDAFTESRTVEEEDNHE